MTREQIEKAAMLFAGAGEFGECPYNPDAKNGFMAGAQWRVNSVWHDASEKPDKNQLVVFECRKGVFCELRRKLRLDEKCSFELGVCNRFIARKKGGEK